MSEFSNHENTDGSRPPVEGHPVVPASEAAERCGCGHLVEDHLHGTGWCRGVWRSGGGRRPCGCTQLRPAGEAPVDAPTVVAAVAADQGHPITPAGLPLRTLTTEPGTVERDAELARWAADDAAQMAASRVAPDPVVRLAGPCVAAASPAWPGGKRCTERWPEIPRGWCAACKSAAQVVEGDGFVRIGSRVYPSGPEWTAVDEPSPAGLELEPDERPLQSEALDLLALTADYPQGHPLREAAARLTARLARAEGRIARARALHRNNDEGDRGSCSTCTDRDYVGLVEDEWPCPTLRALEGDRPGVTVSAEDLDHTPGRPVCDRCPTRSGHNR